MDRKDYLIYFGLFSLCVACGLFMHFSSWLSYRDRLVASIIIIVFVGIIAGDKIGKKLEDSKK